MSRLMYISNLGKQIQYIEKAVATYPELIQGEVDICNMKKQPLWDATFESRLRAADVVLVTKHGGRLRLAVFGTSGTMVVCTSSKILD